jgi:chromosome partitioning protein
MKTITFINEKGGVGKTTLAIHTAAGLALRGFRVAIIDGDAQANATTQLGLKKRGALYNMIVNDESQWKHNLYESPASVWKQGHTTKGDLYICPGDIQTRAIPLVTENTRALYDRLDELKTFLDYVIVDTSPTPSLTHAMFYVASDYIVIPTEAQALSIQGVANTRKRIDEINSNRAASGFKPLELLGVAVNKYRPQTNAHVTGIDVIHRYMGQEIMLPYICHRTIWCDREYQNQTLFTYAPDDVATAEMWEVVDEIINRTNKAKSNG